jgi:caspase domain-containing protein/tetratricopeptide repeat protein
VGKTRIKRALAASVLLILLAFICSLAQERGLEVRRSTGGKEYRRIALVVGNGSYSFSPLRNSVTDAKDMAQALPGFGFEVLCKTNLRQNEMKQAIREFGERIQQGGVGLFYYAGHAVQVDGKNYLIPVGANISHEHEVEYEAVDVGFLLSQMQKARNQLNIVILDSCRNNPFSRRFRSTNDGLASINAPSGTLIAYATAPGSVASDGDGRNGLYTQELLKAMRQPALKIEDVLKRVRSGVQGLTGGMQVPWESSSLVGDFYFVPGSAELKMLPTTETGRNSEDGASPTQVLPNSPALESTNNRSPLSSNAAEVFVNQGDVAAKQKHWAEAESEYRQAVDLDPGNSRLRLKLGDALLQQKKWREAEAQYAVAVRLEPQNKSYQDRLTNLRSRIK